MTKKIITPSGNELDKKLLDDAAADAQQIITDSAILRNLMAVDIVARRLFLITKSAMDNEIAHGWEVESPDLIITILGKSAEEKAIREKFTARDVRDQILSTVLPVLDIICKAEIEDEKLDTETVSRDDAGDEA